MPRRTVVTLVVFAIVGVAAYLLYPRDRFDAVADAVAAIEQQVVDELGRFSTVTCEPPENDDVGARFRCRADVDDGTTLDFDVQVVDGPAVVTDLDI